ncbi:MAG: nicotinamide riboside transporter PnuC [Planctomycetota bacterium]|nr:nicotinamide riboside transporter PnuC [Planctomycetota bacterium]
MSPRAQAALGLALSAVLLALPLATTLLAPLEAVASVAYAWSVWLLARNHPLGWWVGLVGVSAYAVVFFEARLFAEVGLQAVYFVTSLQAIWLWLRGGPARTERPVSSLPAWWWAPTLVVVVGATWALFEVLVHLRGEVPFWDALTTVLSLVAHVYLMGRYVQSWYVWIVVDTIYVPLYASRGLYLTSALYVGFWVLALGGLLTFRRLLAERAQA